MPHSFHIDERVYQQMLYALHGLHILDVVGQERDLGFLQDGVWLTDSAVIESLRRVRGEWEISLVFAHYQRPMQFLRRRIISFSCKRKADLTASLMRRLAAKDQRGTLCIDPDQLLSEPN